MGKVLDIKGDVYGRLTAVEFSHRGKGGISMWKCLCECGNTVLKRTNDLRSGHVKSCGCLQSDSMGVFNKATKSKKVDGYITADHPLYSTYHGMKSRCYWEKHVYFRYYGGRGITVCERWLDSFSAFVKDMGERPEGFTLDRIDPDGPYRPDNCRWATAYEQRHNRSTYDE